MRGRLTPALVLALVAACAAYGQESPGYKVQEPTINNGGSGEASSLASSNYQITLGAVGDPVAQLIPLVSTSFRVAAGFASSFAPPGEVGGLALVNSDTLVWNPDAAAWSYNLYRGSISGLGTSYGGCEQTGMVVTATVDPTVPGTGDGFFYLVTARNHLGEEGIAGRASSTLLRSLPPCP